MTYGPPLALTRRDLIAVLLLILFTAALDLGSLRAGHSWGDDFAMYLHHAKNLAEGVPYTATGYIYNPECADVGPRAYPPMTAILYAPVYRMFGLDLQAFKIEGLLCLLIALVPIYLVCRQELPIPWAVAVSAAFSFNQFVWSFRDRLGSELPFVLFFWLTIYTYMRVGGSAGALATALFIALCYATRTIGIVLLPAIVLYELIMFRRVTARVVIIGCASVVLIGTLGLFFLGSGSYMDQLHITGSTIVENVRVYIYSEYHDLFFTPDSKLLAAITGLCFGVLSLIGYVRHVQTRFSVLDVIVPVYTVTIILWPTEHDLRFFLPLIPIGLLYCFSMLHSFNRTRRRIVLAPFAALLLCSAADAYSLQDRGAIKEGWEDPHYREVDAWIVKSTPPDAVFLAAKPRLLSLLTGRPASPYQDAGLLDYSRRIGVRYVLVNQSNKRDQEVLLPLVEKSADQFRLRFDNKHFRLYELVH